ncbi:MAG: PilZ domain-containing protein, partial [Spirochaetes bacterium]|nr:PilZ domain-containing protein [Spirochaetota bacterium]
ALFNLIVKYKIGFPLTCFTNAKLLDSILKRGLTDIENSNNMSEEEKINNNFLLLEIKSKIELNSKKNMGIRSTHFMVEGQKVILFCRGKGYFYASVKRILNNITIVEIISKKVTRRIFAKNEFLKAYFWREEDAGYTFETQIVDFEEDIRIYHIKHSDKLVRSQKRKYRRVPLNISGELYQVDLKIENNKRVYSLLTDKVVVCNLIELSAGGLKAKSDTMEEKEGIVKVEFEINKYPVSAIGRIVRFHHYAYGLKEFTIQFVKLKMRDKNLINKYVFNYFPDFI